MRLEHLALWRTGDELPSSARSTNWFRKRDAVSCLPCFRPHCFQHVHRSMLCPIILFLIRQSGVDRDSRSSRASLVLFFGFSISAKNLCQPTCWHVFKRGGRASSRGKRRGTGPGEGLGSRVTGMQCRISWYRVKGEKRTPRDAVARRRVYTHTRARHARSACRPSHESKLFVTGGNGQG